MPITPYQLNECSYDEVMISRMRAAVKKNQLVPRFFLHYNVYAARKGRRGRGYSSIHKKPARDDKSNQHHKR